MIKAKLYLEPSFLFSSHYSEEDKKITLEIGRRVYDYFQENLVELVAMPKKGDVISIESFLDNTKFSIEDFFNISDGCFLVVSSFVFYNGFVEIDLE